LDSPVRQERAAFTVKRFDLGGNGLELSTDGVDAWPSVDRLSERDLILFEIVAGLDPLEALEVGLFHSGLSHLGVPQGHPHGAMTQKLHQDLESHASSK
jgi:hypothetical protein